MSQLKPIFQVQTIRAMGEGQGQRYVHFGNEGRAVDVTSDCPLIAQKVATVVGQAFALSAFMGKRVAERQINAAAREGRPMICTLGVYE